MPVWKAVAEVTPLDPNALEGAGGAFVFTVAYGVSKDEFKRSISDALEELQLSLVDLDDVAPIDEHIQFLEEDAASSWLDIAKSVEHSREPYFGEFHVYEQAN